jgi:hypothetical protein
MARAGSREPLDSRNRKIDREEAPSELFRTPPSGHARRHAETMNAATSSGNAPWFGRFNTTLSVKITKAVGTMWCAYAFALLAFVSLPSAIRSGNLVTLVSWISQTFLQLVLLSIIIVGQNVLGAAADMRAEATYQDADAVLRTSLEIQRHLEAQDTEIERILTEVGQLHSRRRVQVSPTTILDGVGV